MCYFPLGVILLPLIGSFFSVGTSIVCVGSFFALKWLFGFSAMTFGIPTACAAANWSVHTEKKSFKNELKKIAISVFLPVLCILLFVMHPVGSAAFFYSFFWLIPIALYFVQTFFFRSFWLTGLCSTFIAHAVGSVIWLYTVPTVPAKWISLIPIVMYERFLFATLAASAYAIIRWAMNKSWVRRRISIFYVCLAGK